MEKMISVIVPVYNIEKYIVECIESLVNQTYKNLQIILIDDGSKDSSGKICDDYAKRDSRIIVIHQLNAGAAAAKNSGLRKASGEYLAFVDSDDYIELDTFSQTVKILEKNKADVVQFCFRDLYTNKTVDNTFSDSTYTVEQYLAKYTEDWTCGLLWDKLFVRSLFDGIFFEEGNVIDDEYFTYQGIMNAKKIVRYNCVFYNYRKRKTSVCFIPENSEKIIINRLDYLIKRRRNVINKFPELKKIFDMSYVDMLIWTSTDPYLADNSIMQLKKDIKSYLKEKRHVKIKLSAIIALYKICFASSKSLLKKKRKYPEKTSINNFFD